jgi:hypothetical protein
LDSVRWGKCPRTDWGSTNTVLFLEFVTMMTSK